MARKPIDVEEEKLRQLDNVNKIIVSLMEAIDVAKADGEHGKMSGLARELKPYFERQAELLGMDAPPHMQKVELAGNIAMLLKLAQNDESDATTDAAANEVGCGPDTRGSP